MPLRIPTYNFRNSTSDIRNPASGFRNPRIAIVQSAPRIGDVEGNADFIIRNLKEVDADVVVFGEMFLSGYLPKERLAEAAQKLDGPVLRRISGAAKKENKYAVFGAPLADEKVKGKIYNAALLVHPDGCIDHYEKWFLPNFGPFEEKWFFAPGERLPVFETRFGKVGMQICYDLFFPEITRAYALQGADIVFCISASPSITRRFFEALVPARAIENTVFVVFCNLAGPQDKMVFWGGGCAVDPRGNVLAKAKYFESGAVAVDINLGAIGDFRKNRPTLADSRIENYLRIYDILRQIKGMHRRD